MLTNTRLWDPLGPCMSMKMHMLALESMVTIEQMKNQMMMAIMMLLMTMARRMGTSVAHSLKACAPSS
jgi:membrane protease subunit (stomatin/prohibitin family)